VPSETSAAAATSLQNRRLAPFEKNSDDLDMAMGLILQQRQDAGQRATFIQIGANDGIMYDPLYEYMHSNNHSQQEWIGLQVEPQTELFQNLPIIHRDAKDWAFYNGAMAGAKLMRQRDDPILRDKNSRGRKLGYPRTIEHDRFEPMSRLPQNSYQGASVCCIV
jgi:hypothetical protein